MTSARSTDIGLLLAGNSPALDSGQRGQAVAKGEPLPWDIRPLTGHAALRCPHRFGRAIAQRVSRERAPPEGE